MASRPTAADGLAPGRRGRGRRGPRIGVSRTREAILTHAGEALAEARGETVTIRNIADRAAVDPALVYYFFGDRSTLFREAIRSIKIDEGFERISHTHAFGEEFARWYFGLWEAPLSGQRMAGLLRLAMSDCHAHQAVTEFLRERVIGLFKDHCADGPDIPLRAGLAAATLMGAAVHRYVLKIPELADPPLNVFVQTIGRAIDAHLGDAQMAVLPTEN